MTQIDFSLSDHEEAPREDFAPLPNGDYPVVVQSSDKPTSKAGHVYFKIVFQVIEGEAKNRLIFDNLNCYHPNADVASRAKGSLYRLGEAVGKIGATDTSEFHNIPLVVTVKSKRNGDRVDTNVVAYKRMGDQSQPLEPPKPKHNYNDVSPWQNEG